MPKFPLHTGNRYLDWLLLAVPAAFVVHFLQPAPLVMFALAALAIIPVAAALGESTEALAAHTGPRLGGLLNATLGNATELIISIFLVHAGQIEVVKASLSGSIIGNALLVLGMSALAGGMGREKQSFSRSMAAVNSSMLFVAVVALVMPAVFDLAVYGHLTAQTRRVEHLSLATSAVLIVIYVLSLVFSLRHRTPRPVRETHNAVPRPQRSAKAALISLAVATVLVALLSEVLVGQIEAAKARLGVSDLFMGVIVIALIGNAAEHATAVLMARRDHMDLAIAIAIGSSSQIALFVAPVLVFAAWLVGQPMTLVFTPFEIAGIGLAVLIVEMISADGETTWFEGAELMAVYLILALCFYFVPAR